MDTGITLSFLLDHIQERRPRSLKVCALIDKPRDRKVDVRPDWAAFTLREPLPDDGFIVGYGLDWAETTAACRTWAPFRGRRRRPRAGRSPCPRGDRDRQQAAGAFVG